MKVYRIIYLLIDGTNLLGLSIVTFSDKMRGKSNFTLKAVARLVEIFDLPAKYLLKRNDGISPITLEREKGEKISARVRRKSPFKNLLNKMGKRNFLYDAWQSFWSYQKVHFPKKCKAKLNSLTKTLPSSLKFLANLLNIFLNVTTIKNF